ncbi:Gustatory receptor 119d, partial [Halyomorpha halys]
MVSVAPCQPAIGKVDLVLNDVFKLSRLIGTFPIDQEYSAISKWNLAKATILYLPGTIMAILQIRWLILLENVLFVDKVTYSLQTTLPIGFCWIHIAWLVRNRCLMKDLYGELKDMEYNLWKSGICWIHKPNCCIKYITLAIMLVSIISWDTMNGFANPENFTYYIFDVALVTITSDYAILVQVFLSILTYVRAIEDSHIVIKLADKVLALCRKFNKLYELQIVWYLAFVYFYILFSVFIMIVRNKKITGLPLIYLTSLVSPFVHIVLNVRFFSQE